MNLTDKKFMIVGTGKSGLAAAGLLVSVGVENIIIYDDNKELSKEALRSKLPAEFKGIILLGEKPEEICGDIDFLVLSPGVPIDLPYVLEYKEKGVRVIGEIELAYYFSKGRIIGITGTNGKTTTTTLMGEIMKAWNPETIVVGNIGIPYTEMVCRTTENSITVAELSSFQLDTTETFHPNVSMVLNITPDHLNRHHTMENYIDAKFRIAEFQTMEDVCVLNYEDATLREKAEKLHTNIMWFSSKRELKPGLFVRNEVIYWNDGEQDTEVINVHDMNLIGAHNYENVMAAVAGAIFMGVPMELIRETVRNFSPVEHRIEYTATKNGVKYYNDSKGTNPDASIQAVKAMTTKTVLIGGGYDKDSEYDDWIKSFDGKIKYLVLMGQTRDKIAACARKYGFNDIVMVESMEEAVSFAAQNTVPGETVLLSPCCASWGMFKNYEERGRIFKELVRALPD